MNIEKAIIAAIITLGIAGSAALASGGRLDPGHGSGNLMAGSELVEGETLGVQLPTHAQDAFFQMLGN